LRKKLALIGHSKKMLFRDCLNHFREPSGVTPDNAPAATFSGSSSASAPDTDIET